MQKMIITIKNTLYFNKLFKKKHLGDFTLLQSVSGLRFGCTADDKFLDRVRESRIIRWELFVILARFNILLSK